MFPIFSCSQYPHQQVPQDPDCRVCARLGVVLVVFVELYIFSARAVNPLTKRHWYGLLCYKNKIKTNDRPEAYSARKTKHKTPQLLCSSSAVFAHRRAKSPSGSACDGQRGPTCSSPTPQIPVTWQLALVYGPPRPQNPVS